MPRRLDNMTENDFSVFLENRLIGIAKDMQEDWPWARGTFVPTPDFQSVKELFDDEYRYMKENKNAEREVVLERIWSLGFRLESAVHGAAIGCRIEDAIQGKSIVMVHIHDGKISWRE